MSWSEIAVIVTTILGGGGWIRFIAEKKKTSADARKTEIDSSVIINKQWQELFENYKKETQEELQILRRRIEHLESELEKEKKRVKELENGAAN